MAFSHGASDLPEVTIESYNLELKEGDDFVGDRASRRAFVDLLEKWREGFREAGDDPLGRQQSDELTKRKLDKLLLEGDAEAAGIVHGAMEDFAQELTEVIRRFMRMEAWQGTERIVIGGGFSGGRVGEIAIGRANALLKNGPIETNLVPIRYDPDEAALIGANHLAPYGQNNAYDGILAVDIGGSNIRCGVVLHQRKKAADKPRSKVWRSELWRHGDEEINRDQAVETLLSMLSGLIKGAEKGKISLAPFIGIGCPGIIEADGSISRGGQNLPGGDWESGSFNLPDEVAKAIPMIGGEKVTVSMHNDAVVQGLCEIPFMTDVKRWGVLTIGTGLGNAVFLNK